MTVHFLVWDDVTKEVGYATTIPASRISDLSVVVPAFYSETDDLSDVTIHRVSGVSVDGKETLNVFNIAAPTELLTGFAATSGGVTTLIVRYTIDGGSTVDLPYPANIVGAQPMLHLVPVKADSSLRLDLYNNATSDYHFTCWAVTKCPFLDEKKPNILVDIDKNGRPVVIHEARRVIDASAYVPPEKGKHVHLVGDYEISQFPRHLPADYIRYKNGKFERVKWGYVFRKEVSILGQTQVLWTRTFEFDRELSKDEIAQIERELGAKFIGII